MPTPPSFGAWVRQRRKALGRTQTDLAAQVGCSTEMIRKVEMDRRRPSAQIAELLARCLEVPPAERPAFLRAARLARRDNPDAAGVESPAPRGDILPGTPELIGREQLAAHVQQLLQPPGARMVTLAGPGGVGKTTLAYYVAERAGAAFAGGRLVVPMATVEQAEQVPAALVEALRLPETSQQAPLDRLIAHLAERQMLLVLDNMEQVAAAAPTIGALLAACPALTVLATSRVPLRAPSEHVVEVPPLDLPAQNTATNPAALLRSSAARLFVARACEVRPDFALTAANAGAVAAICRQMDGLPLAIELVAARSNVLAPQALLDRLNGSHGYAPLELPSNPLPSPSARHQTLRDAIGWSFDLLSEPLRRLFSWLGIFNGGLTLAASEAVCAGAHLRPIDILDGLQALIDAHLVARQPAEGDTLRFGMLLTIREYALERLAAAGELEAAHAAHSSYYLEFTQQTRAQFQAAGQELAMDQLEREHDNLRAALRWSIEHSIGQAAEFGAALWWFWYVRSHWREGHAWLEQILRRSQQLGAALPDPTRARLLRGAGALAEQLANYQQAAEWTTQSLAISRAAENWQGMVATLNNLGGLYHLLGQSERARECLEEALQLARATGRTTAEATALGCLGSLATDEGRYHEAQAYLNQSLAIVQGLDYHFGVVSARLYLADLALAQRDDARAAEHYSFVLAEQRKHNNWEDVVLALLGLGWISYHQGKPRQGLRAQQEALQISQEHGVQQLIILCLEGCAASLGMLGSLESARLLGAATAARELLGTPRHWTQRRTLDQAMESAARAHDPATWAAACEYGRALPLAQAVARALSLGGKA
jgi:predicted ATPase/transcriptional regulator with XRE-family HTH domain